MTPSGIEPTFKALGVDGRTYLDALSRQALRAYAHQCAPANPRTPMPDDMRELTRTAHYG
ncbi:alcohol dehydrogenase [Streptomyces sp. rh34]|uniref:alcohol dehydrogenase n=1 Tax=Streptomyces sp. rh34 TaxID=2034272 RepID=UPI0015CF39B1|nr:alcohol dehydrogenase [Streptomyces sp. rh34]